MSIRAEIPCCLQTGLKIHWSRRSASSCFNRVWNVTISSAKHQSMLRPWVMQHVISMNPGPAHRHGLRQGPYMGAKLLSFDPSFPLFLFFSFFLTGPTSVALSCVSSRLIFAPKRTFRVKRRKSRTAYSMSHRRHCRACMHDCTLAAPP